MPEWAATRSGDLQLMKTESQTVPPAEVKPGIDTRNHPAVLALADHQARLAENETQFARRRLGMSPATWTTLKSGTYGAQDPSRMLELCETALATLDDLSANAVRQGKKSAILSLPHVKATITAVRRCAGEQDNKLVVVLAPSGGGKTTLSRRLREEFLHAAVSVEATETWRGSYFNALLAIATELGATAKFTTAKQAETFVVDRLARGQQILVIDEAHYCGPQALNLLKMLLNQTSARVVILAIPALWERMETNAYEEAKQLRRRTCAKIVVPRLTAEVARNFLSAKLSGWAVLGEEEPEALAACLAAANAFGLFDTLHRICAEKAQENEAAGATLAMVKAAIKRVEALRS